MDIDKQEALYLFMAALTIMALSAIVLGKFAHLITKNHMDYELNTRSLRLEHEKRLMAAKLEMQELTFQQIAHELHDNIKQSLDLSTLNLYSLKKSPEQEKPEKIQSTIQELKKVTSQIVNLSRSLNPGWITTIGLARALQNEIDKIQATGLFVIESHFSENRVTMEAEREVIIVRIVQEVFNNIIRHSGAQNIHFSLQYNQDQAHLIITDNGCGFNSTGSSTSMKGSGLNNIQVRAKALNARLNIDSTPVQGTTVNLAVPYNSNHFTT
jgi:signal transduction histidine kinase